LFRDLERAVVRVSGSDRVRWLDGMITNDVKALEVGTERSGCYAALLSPKGRIIADMQVLERGDAFWLDVDAAATALVLATLGRYIIADDVTLEDCSAQFDRVGIEGPATAAIVERVAAESTDLAPNANVALEFGGCAVVAARFGFSGEDAMQFIAPAGAADDLVDRLLAAGRDVGLVASDNATLEVLRIEAGVPRFGAELDESVLPAEAGLDRAFTDGKGCYTGQEIVERMRSQGAASHRLVGVMAAGPAAFAVGDELVVNDRRAGEITSACVSEAVGAIALAFVRRAFAKPGTEVAVAGRSARIVALPFVAGATAD
jgi:folate-binding protein YgfZ